MGDLQGKSPSRFLLMELVSVLYEVFGPGSARFSSYRPIMVSSYRIMFQCCTRSSGQVRRSLLSSGLLVPIMVSSYRIMFQCCTRSSGQVRRSLLSIGPLVYKCSMRSLAWLCVLLFYLVATRRISSVILGMWRSLWSRLLLTYQGASTMLLRTFDWKRWIIFNLVSLAHPHNWTPYDQMGLRTTL